MYGWCLPLLRLSCCCCSSCSSAISGHLQPFDHFTRLKHLTMNIAMLGSGFIGRFYADSLQGYRSKDKIVSIYSRKEESAKKFALDYHVPFSTIVMEDAINRPDVDVVCISLPNNLHEEAVMLCCKHKKAVITTKPLGRNAEEAKRMLEAVEKAKIFNGYLEDLVYTPKFIKAHESVK